MTTLVYSTVISTTDTSCIILCNIMISLFTVIDTVMNSLIIPTVTVTTNVCPSKLTIKHIKYNYISTIANERQQTSYLAGNL